METCNNGSSSKIQKQEEIIDDKYQVPLQMQIPPGFRIKSEEITIKEENAEKVYGRDVIAVFNILCASAYANRPNEIDWYSTLQLSPSAEASEIELQYNRLRLMLDPIKNSFFGASTALELVQDAYDVLSDPQRRLVFDRQRIALDDDELGSQRNIEDVAYTHDQEKSQLGEEEEEESKVTWSMEDFEVGKVWAIYGGGDDEDDAHQALPRSYAMIKNAVSLNEVKVALLEPHPIVDEERQWLEEYLPISCGVFRLSGVHFVKMARFSHLVEFQKNKNKHLYRILPRRGQVWAMYVGWNSMWKPCDMVDCEYQLVEILSLSETNGGISVYHLVEVDEWKTFFQRKTHKGKDSSLFMELVPRSQMMRFSHQIPTYEIFGNWSHRFQQKTWNLKHNALPLKLVKYMMF